MIDYYEYLLKISWPALTGLFVIYAFLGLRAFRAVQKAARKRTIPLDWLTVSARVVITVIVCTIYTFMFTVSYGDWFKPPAVSRGVVESVAARQGASGMDYFMTAVCGEELITVQVDSVLYETLRKEDLIEFAYLPLKKEVFRCTILTQQDAKIIY